LSSEVVTEGKIDETLNGGWLGPKGVASVSVGTSKLLQEGWLGFKTVLRGVIGVPEGELEGILEVWEFAVGLLSPLDMFIGGTDSTYATVSDLLFNYIKIIGDIKSLTENTTPAAFDEVVICVSEVLRAPWLLAEF
jgi:hypothetical protein